MALPPGVDEQSIGAEERVERFRRHASALARKADLEISACLRLYRECAEIYGTEGAPWYPRDMVGKIEDDDYGDFWLDSMDEPR